MLRSRSPIVRTPARDVIVLRESGEVVGTTLLKPLPGSHGEIEVGWHVARPHRGKGYATEAAAAARSWAYEDRGYRQLVSYVHPLNAASVAVAERLGATLETETTLRGEERLLFRHPDQSLA